MIYHVFCRIALLSVRDVIINQPTQNPQCVYTHYMNVIFFLELRMRTVVINQRAAIARRHHFHCHVVRSFLLLVYFVARHICSRFFCS